MAGNKLREQIAELFGQQVLDNAIRPSQEGLRLIFRIFENASKFGIPPTWDSTDFCELIWMAITGTCLIEDCPDGKTDTLAAAVAAIVHMMKHVVEKEEHNDGCPAHKLFGKVEHKRDPNERSH